jgi:HAE1 family hydrophobic/amphiphilic exporter-1
MVLIHNLAQGKYQNLLGKIINRRAITYCTCRCLCRTWLISSTVPSGFIPNEDQGMFIIIQTPDLH